ncbi:MAG: exo-beta-N-acetylmuramidase NamZ domain-containing protein, partial [Myxococcota bacterium]
MVRTGLDRIRAGDLEALAAVQGRVGLLAHPASVDRSLRHAYRVLLDGGVNVTALFGPEHGFSGAAQDMISVGADATAEGVKIYSLYGPTFGD